MVTAPDIPGHRVGGVLGAGGFATVYRCWQLAVGREVAVKVGNRALLTERDRRRFIREVTAASRRGPARRLPTPAWDIQVLPPSEAAYDSGSRVYRCLANEIGHEPGTSQFRR